MSKSPAFPEQPSNAGLTFFRSLQSRDWAFGVFIALATLIAYLPALNGKFIWDDDSWTTNISGLLRDFSGLRTMWLHPTALQQYYPLAGTTFWIDYHLWGFWTLPYHLENVFLHVLCALLFWQLLRRLGVAGAELAGTIFALHPIMVESVAWITERKNTLSLVFFLGALLAYGRFANFWKKDEDSEVEPRVASWRSGVYALAFILFLCAMLAKTTAFSFPAVVLLICWWKRGQIRWQADALPTLPFFALAIGLSLFTSWLEKHHVGASGADWNHSFFERCQVAGRIFWFYIGKLLWPANLCFVYPQWRLDTESFRLWLYTIAAVGLFLGLWMARARIGRSPIAATLFYVGTLFPVLGFMNAYFMRFSFVCDHWVYLPSLGLIAFGASAIAQAATRFRKPAVIWIIALVLLPTLAILTWRQCGMYSDLETLWRTTIAKSPNAWMAHENLAGMLLPEGRLAEAIAHFQKSLEIQPRDTFAHDGLGMALFKSGRSDEAAAQFQASLKIDPNDVDAINNLANLSLQNGQLDDAIVHFQKLLELDPKNTYACDKLGSAFLQKGQISEAIANFQKSLEIQPHDADTQNELANLFLQEGKLDEAMTHYQESLEINPTNSNAEANLGSILLLKKQVDEALVHLRKAVTINPNNASAQANLGNVFFQRRQLTDAVAHYHKALENDPNNMHLLNNLARVLATSPDASIRNGAEAVTLMKRAYNLSGGGNPWIIATLASADAETGQFSEAVSAAQQALSIASAQHNTALVNALQIQIKLYQAGLPFRDSSLTNAPLKN